MNKIELELINKVAKQLKMEIEIEEMAKKLIIQCDNKCRLLSHLFHRADLDVHCTQYGIFEIPYDKYSKDDVMNALYDIQAHPEWVIEFIEKYIDNEFMMASTFKPVEVSE